MVKQLEFWLEGIIEDDPIPEEIDILLFKVHKNGLYKYLELNGYEKEINNNSVTYYPLEAQFFNCKELAQLGDNLFYIRAKNIIEEAFSSSVLQQQLKGRKIFFQYGDRIDFLFRV